MSASITGTPVPPGKAGTPDYVAPSDQQGASEVSPPMGDVLGLAPVSITGALTQNQLGTGDAGAVLKGRRPGQ